MNVSRRKILGMTASLPLAATGSELGARLSHADVPKYQVISFVDPKTGKEQTYARPLWSSQIAESRNCFSHMLGHGAKM
jgi:hypothetical protein